MSKRCKLKFVGVSRGNSGEGSSGGIIKKLNKKSQIIFILLKLTGMVRNNQA